ARFARTSRGSSTYRGTSTTKISPLASEKFRRATVGSSLEIRVSTALASKRWNGLSGAAGDTRCVRAEVGEVGAHVAQQRKTLARPTTYLQIDELIGPH